MYFHIKGSILNALHRKLSTVPVQVLFVYKEENKNTLQQLIMVDFTVLFVHVLLCLVSVQKNLATLGSSFQ
jgi:uncharacterized membrane protein YqjE